jgi:hypothetical protein
MNININRDPDKGRIGTPVSMTASFNSHAYLLDRMKGYSICGQCTETVASLAGVFKLQASNNAFADNVNMDVNPNAVWVDIPSSSITLTAGSTQVFWNVTDVHYEAVRVVWTSTTGQGIFTPYFMAKG